MGGSPSSSASPRWAEVSSDLPPPFPAAPPPHTRPPHPLRAPPAQLRDECLSFAPRLFVEDACVGGARESEVRVRVVTDSAAAALFFRSALQRTPLYAPEAFPRTLTVLVATLAAPEGVAAARGKPGPFTVVDVDPLTARGTVLAVGAAPLGGTEDSVAAAVAAAAGQLMTLGGYRHVGGGAQNAALVKSCNVSCCTC